MNKKMRSHRSGADGVVAIAAVFQKCILKRSPFLTTINASPYRARASRPSAPLKEASRLLLDVASTPPISGGEGAHLNLFTQNQRNTRGRRPRLQSGAAVFNWLKIKAG